MKYVSTRAQALELDFEQAATCGLASDGGLYIPKTWPAFDVGELKSFKELSYTELAVQVVSRFTGTNLSQEELRELMCSAYSNFDHPQIAPLQEIKPGLHILELFHGPTLSFKDYAMQFLGRFMDWSLKRREEHITIVGATSGDTGSAAINAVAGRSTIDLFMLHPFQRVSDMQRRQMTTNQDRNIYNYAVDGTFDDCQAIVKAIFNDAEVRRDRSLGAVNSINWGRIAAQVVYYFYAAIQLGAIETPVSFAVPTGNFGNVFAGYAASRMGLPIEQIVVCSNENDILTRFFETGIMRKQGVKQTVTPSMDIEVSSNFERFLFELLDRDGEHVSSLMEQLSKTGQFRVVPRILDRARSCFSAFRVNDKETQEAISRQYSETGTIVDPHTAVALATVDQVTTSPNTPLVVISTAHPAKFSDTIERAINKPVSMPAQLNGLLEMPEKYRRISNNPDELKRLMLSV